ncbi:MAG: 18S rRNA maturation protein [Trizodia sp. TS-e1964]|nr:MAG: 18S rRNA maturation protein [Trizodia sp. TS-e1964]
MATKPDHDNFEKMHASRKALLKPSVKKRRHMKTATLSKPPSINSLKKQIRDLSRQLERSEALPAGTRTEKERAIAGYGRDLVCLQAEKHKQRMIKKYHMVRFFDRQKATRRLKKIRKQLSTLTDQSEIEKLSKTVHDAEVDLNYTLFCPLDERYISLFPPQGQESSNDAKDNGFKPVPAKPPLWKEIERRMEDQSLEILRQGKRNVSIHLSSSGINSEVNSERFKQIVENRDLKKPKPSHQPTVNKQEPLDGGADSDGGFFEE